MKVKIIKRLILLLAIPLIFPACFPTYQAVKIETDSLASGEYSDVQAKIFLEDNSIIIFPHGYIMDSNYIYGSGQIITFDTSSNLKDEIRVPLDSIAAMINYEENTSGVRYFGSFLLGLTGPPLTFLGVYCLLCPKCCFGSCPTVYVFDGKDYNLESELFSECISKQLEDNDIDLLYTNINNDRLNIKITKEALETHYINKFEVVIAEHPLNTKVFPSTNDKIFLVNEYLYPFSSENKEGTDLNELLSEDDGNYYRSGYEKVAELKNGPSFDYIDIKAPASKINPSKIILKYRNSLLSTTLLYDVVIGSQGIAGMEWTKKMNEDAGYASQFKMIYDAFSGIKIKMYDGSTWKNIGRFEDAGPLNWKYIAAEIPPCGSDTVQMRLEFVPDNFIIDYIAFDTTAAAVPVESSLVYPAEVTDGSGNDRKELLDYICKDDMNYLLTEPGDTYTLIYNIPEKENCSQTAFINSKGYYNEWIRGGWIRNYDKDLAFNLYDINGTLARLADSWIKNHELLEKEFFHSRFILREEK